MSYDAVLKQKKWPGWAQKDARYQRLATLNALLQGEFYDHLEYSFEEASDSSGKYIPVHLRKPSVTFNIARMVASAIARKLFAGRHAPRILNVKNPKAAESVRSIAKEACLFSTMLHASILGSVGAVAATFKIVNSGSSKKITIDCYPAMDCYPSFDEQKELKELRINYLVDGFDLMMSGAKVDYKGEQIDNTKMYWYVKDLTTDREIRYLPILENEYAPRDPQETLVEDTDNCSKHDLGYVPAHWFVNLGGGKFPDGACTFDDAKKNMVKLDESMSLLGQGVDYNANPQVVLTGRLINQKDSSGNTIARGGTNHFQFEAEYDDGNVKTGAGKAELLEMTGQGISIGVKDFCSKLLKLMLLIISANRKDPDQVTTAMSGKAMEYLEAEFLDLVQEQRTSYGEEGSLRLLKKICLAAMKVEHPLAKGLKIEDIDGLSYLWPPLCELTATEVQQLVQGLVQAVAGDKEGRGAILEEAKAAEYFESQVDLPETTTDQTFAESIVGGETEKPKEPTPQHQEVK